MSTIIKYLQSIILSIALFGFFSSYGQEDSSRTFKQPYIVGSIPELKSFKKYTELEKRLDKKDIRDNRGRIFLNLFINNEIIDVDSSFKTGFPTKCQCLIDNDTIFVNLGFGFFSGLGFNLEVFNDKFNGSFYQYTKDVKSYKSNLKDTSFYDYVVVENKYQYLIFSEKPTFLSGQKLTGYLTYTSNNYYQQNYDNQIDTNYVGGKLYFTCKTRLKAKLE